ncbi:MAG: hypothetical protein KC505_06995 [Myxococcales bacterium]|nr:hypothetical protein [Myxococcales bacterium]USN50506.1 MAG: hypothetical protein H6731_09625 [Myxococcales bacterium]
MKPSNIPPDPSLLISRFQQKELYQSASKSSNISLSMSQLPNHYIAPFFDPLAIKIGLKLKLLGAKIIHCQIERGFLSHGLEKIIAQDGYKDAINDIARINQRTPIFYQMALLSAYENLCAIHVSQEIKMTRALALEIARIYHHFYVCKNVFVSLNADSLFELARNGKNSIKDFAKIFGNLDEIEKQSPKLIIDELIDICDFITQIVEDINNSFEQENILIPKLKQKAVINLTAASSLGLTGAFIRANRCIYDLRLQKQASIDYIKIPKINTSEGGDAFARLNLRILDILSSSLWLKEKLKQFDERNYKFIAFDYEKIPDVELAQKNFSFGEIESPEGDIKAALFIDKEHSLTFHLRTPAYFIAQALPQLLLHADLDDLPALLASLGISAEEIDK